MKLAGVYITLMTLQCLLIKNKTDDYRQLLNFIEKTGTLSSPVVISSDEMEGILDRTMPDIIFLDMKQYPLVQFLLADADVKPLFVFIADKKNPVNGPLPTPFFTIPITGLTYENLLDTINKVIVHLLSIKPHTTYKDDNYFFIKSEYRIVKVNFNDILFCEGLKDYTQIYTSKKNKPIITLQNLKTFSERLPVRKFVRIHRSYIISLNYIESISKKEVEIGEKILPIGNSYRNNLLDIVKMNS